MAQWCWSMQRGSRQGRCTFWMQCCRVWWWLVMVETCHPHPCWRNHLVRCCHGGSVGVWVLTSLDSVEVLFFGAGCYWASSAANDVAWSRGHLVSPLEEILHREHPLPICSWLGQAFRSVQVCLGDKQSCNWSANWVLLCFCWLTGHVQKQQWGTVELAAQTHLTPGKFLSSFPLG